MTNWTPDTLKTITIGHERFEGHNLEIVLVLARGLLLEYTAQVPPDALWWDEVDGWMPGVTVAILVSSPEQVNNLSSGKRAAFDPAHFLVDPLTEIRKAEAETDAFMRRTRAT